MTAEFEITRDDLVAFNQFHNRHSPMARRQFLIAWLLPVVAWFLVFSVIWYFADKHRGTPLRTLLDLLPLLSFVPIYLLYFPWAYRRKLRKLVGGMVSEGRNRGLLGWHRVGISPTEITEANGHGQTSIRWSGIERVAAENGLAFIYTSAISAIIVPERAFPDPVEFEQFLRQAREYHEKEFPELR